VYEQCAKLLFHKWDARRRIHLDLQAGHLLEPALRHLAHWLFTRDQAQPAVTERELVDETSAVLREHGFESEVKAKEAAAEFVEFCRGRMWVFSDVGTTADGQALYAFTHRTFMEYFTAAHLAYTSDTPEKLARALASHVARHEWEVVGELAVQIKDHTSKLGAERIYTALLGERRRRSVERRGGVLQFLARSLRSVTPTPATVRTLAGRILDHSFAGNPNASADYLPLCWLLASCSTGAEVVNDIIHSRATEMIGSTNPVIRLNGLRLAIFLPYGAMYAGENGPASSWDLPLTKFWEAQAAANIRAHANDIIAAATSDGGIMRAALAEGLLTINQVLEMPNGLLHLLRSQEFGIFNSSWASKIYAAIGLARGVHDQTNIEDFAAIGRYLMTYATPPFVTGEVEEWTQHLDIPLEDAHPILDATSYLGAAASLLISSESTTPPLPEGGPQQLGILSDLYHYIARRWRLESDLTLPELPISDDFRQLFRDWADNKVDFVGPQAS
jgi:hypothetical protein